MIEHMGERHQEEPDQAYQPARIRTQNRRLPRRRSRRTPSATRPRAHDDARIDRHSATTDRTHRPVVGAQACLRLPTVVIATRDRRQRLLATLAHLDALAERPPGRGGGQRLERRHGRGRAPPVSRCRGERVRGSSRIGGAYARRRGRRHAAGRLQRRRLVVGSGRTSPCGGVVPGLSTAWTDRGADHRRAGRPPGSDLSRDASQPAGARAGPAGSAGPRVPRVRGDRPTGGGAGLRRLPRALWIRRRRASARGRPGDGRLGTGVRGRVSSRTTSRRLVRAAGKASTNCATCSGRPGCDVRCRAPYL